MEDWDHGGGRAGRGYSSMIEKWICGGKMKDDRRGKPRIRRESMTQISPFSVTYSRIWRSLISLALHQCSLSLMLAAV